MAGVREYFVWRTFEERFDWFLFVDAEFVPAQADRRGLLRGRFFPGLVLDVKALLSLEGGKVLQTLKRGLASSARRQFLATATRRR